MAGVYKARGKITPEPCFECGAPDAEMHHDDYLKPLEVRWLCRTCHLSGHYPTAREKRDRPRRLLVRHGGSLCSRCLQQPPAGKAQRYCKKCHADYERDRRRAQRAELIRLKALEEEIKLLKGKDNGQSGSGRSCEAD